MKNKELESLQDIEDARKLFRYRYAEAVKKFSRDFDILKHSKANDEIKPFFFADKAEKDQILVISQNILEIQEYFDTRFDQLSSSLSNFNTEQTQSPLYKENFSQIVRHITETTDELNELEESINKLRQELPIVQSLQLFIRETSELFGKFCTAVVNFFTKIAPKEEADKAQASMLTHFEQLKKSVNKHQIEKYPQVSIQGSNFTI